VDTWLLFALIGLGTGAVYVALGTGLVITYRGTGVINFATGAMAMWGAYVYVELRQTGDLVLPVVGVPDRVSFGSGVAFVPALAAGIVASAVLGLAVHWLVFRPLTRAPVLAKVVASVGLMIVLQALATLKFGSEPRAPAPILPDDPVRLGDISVPRDRLILAAIGVLIGLGVAAWFRRSRTGLAILAAAEDERAATLAGYEPRRLAGVTWVLSAVVTGTMVLLTAPITNLNPVRHSLYVVPALAAALVGRLRSLPATLVAGLALGMLQSELTFARTRTWYPEWAQQGLTDAVPFVVVIVALYVLGRALPQRGAAENDPLPKVRIPQLRPRSVALLTGAGAAAILLTSGSYRFGVITSLIATVIALSIVLLTGLVGQISLAQAAFAGSAGFALSKIGTAIPFPLSTLLAATVAAALGAVVGIPALRIRGAQLAVVTLAAALAIEQFVFRNPQLVSNRGSLVPAPELLGVDLGVREGTNIARAQFGLLVLAITVLAAVALSNLMRSATGRRFLAVRTNERAGASLGVDIKKVKLTAFVLSSFLAGLGGALIGYSRGQLSADSFGVFAGLSFLAFAYLGGITSISGAVLAGTFAPLGITYVVMKRWVGDSLDDHYFLLGGLGLITTAITYPVGIAGAVSERWARWRQREGRLPVAHVAPRSAALRREPPARPPARTLRVTGLGVRYGGVTAVDGVDLAVEPGRIVGLIGPNGAGKTSLIDAVTGFTPATGTVVLDDHRLDGLAPHERARAGIVRTWQSLELFGDLTVHQNLLVATERMGIRSVAVDLVRPIRGSSAPHIDWALDLLGLDDVVDRVPTDLSLGRQKLVGVARALAMAPSVILLDEPAAGLDTAESAAFGARLREVAASGIGVLLVDHDMGLVLDVCDDVYVMEFGRVIAHGVAGDVRTDPAVVAAYLGTASREVVAL